MFAEQQVPPAPSPPPPPGVMSPAEQAQLQRELRQAGVDVRAEVGAAVEAAQQEARQPAANAGARATARVGDQPNVSVLRDPHGRTVVRTGDGREIVIDPRTGLSEDAQLNVIAQALAHAREQPPPPPPPRDANLDMFIPMLGIIFGCVTAMVLGLPIVRAWVRRFERRGGAVAPALPAEWGGRLERIEQAVESVAIEVERISEAQRFQARLLHERVPEAPLAPSLAHTRQAESAALPGPRAAGAP